MNIKLFFLLAAFCLAESLPINNGNYLTQDNKILQSLNGKHFSIRKSEYGNEKAGGGC